MQISGFSIAADLSYSTTYFQNGKCYHIENLHRNLFLRDLLLHVDGNKTLKVLAILEF